MEVQSKKEILSSKILRYLEKHPKAGDTLEGIAFWWLQQQLIEEVVDEVEEALDFLVKKGVIEANISQAGLTVYKIKK